MPSQKVQPSAIGPPGALARPDWYAGGELTAADLNLEQECLFQRLRRHLRYMHGWGVVCGLNVVAAGDGGNWDLFVCPGYGIGPCGDEIVVPARFRFNVSDYLWTLPVGASAARAWVSIEASGDDAPAPECGCYGSREEDSLTPDGFRVVISWTPPLSYQGGFDICSGGAPPCPVCPETCELPLASVTLPPASERIPQSFIDNLGNR